MNGPNRNNNNKQIKRTSNQDVNNLPAMPSCLDFEKAFDSLDWSFTFKVLLVYGFGDGGCPIRRI